MEKPSGEWISETSEIIWDNTDSTRAVFRIDAPAAKGAIGYIGGRRIELGNLTIEMDSIPGNWAAITLTSLDGKPIEESSKILIVAAGKAENTGWQWNENKTSLGGNWGNAPTRVEGIPAKLTFSNMYKFKIRPLDAYRKPGEEIPVNRKGKNHSVGIGAQYKTLWYLIERD